MRDLLMQACPDFVTTYGHIAIVLDASGKVSEVEHDASVPMDVVACVQSTLAGLTFPCLGGYQVCPKYVIVE